MMTWGLRRHNKAVRDIDPTQWGMDGTKESLEDYDVMSEWSNWERQRGKESQSEKDNSRGGSGGWLFVVSGYGDMHGWVKHNLLREDATGSVSALSGSVHTYICQVLEWESEGATEEWEETAWVWMQTGQQRHLGTDLAIRHLTSVDVGENF